MAAVNFAIRGVRTLYDIVRRFALLMLTAALLPSAAVCAQSPRRAESESRPAGPQIDAATLVHSSALPSSTPAPKRDIAIRAATEPRGDACDRTSGSSDALPVVRVDVVVRGWFARPTDDSPHCDAVKRGASPEPGEHASCLPAAP
jgi:hypothetical protein